MGEGRVEFGREEGEEEVEEVDAEGVCDCLRIAVSGIDRVMCAVEQGSSESGQTDIPSLRKDNSEEEKEKQNDAADPSVCGIWCQLI